MKIIKYVLGGLLILSGLGFMFNGSFLGGLLIILVGVAILPPVSEKNQEKYPFWRKAILRRSMLLVLLFIGFVIAGVQTNGFENQNQSNSVSEKPIESKPKIINLSKTYYDANGNKIEPNEGDITYKVIEVLKHTKLNPENSLTGKFENLSLLVEVSNDDEEVLSDITQLIKKEYIKFAPKNYLLELWNDKEAYKKSIEREKYFSESFDKLMAEFQRTRVPFNDKHEKLKRQWDKKHYSFIADHNLSTISNNGGFNYYPLQDMYYKEIGGVNFKK